MVEEPLFTHCRAQFARRDSLYYQSTSVKQQDAIVIICTITSAPVPPVGSPSIPLQLVPKTLLGSIGGLLDEYVPSRFRRCKALIHLLSPNYSDVEFVIPRRRGARKDLRRIYAAKGLLRRVEYFDTSKRSVSLTPYHEGSE